MESILNGSSYYAYFTITGLNGATRRAWLVPPVDPGEGLLQVATIQLETFCEDIGCGGSPQTVAVETNQAGWGQPILQQTPCTLRVYNPVAGTWFLGCTSVGAGPGLEGSSLLTYSTSSCIGADVTDEWLVLQSQVRSADLPKLRSGTTLVASTIVTNRVLRALPTLDETVFQLGWVPVAANVGFDLTMMLVSTGSGSCCPPSGPDDPVFPPDPCTDL
jgi:hypothetical protein